MNRLGGTPRTLYYTHPSPLLNIMYYIKLNDRYLQTDDRDRPYFDEDKCGTLYKATNSETARQLLGVLFPGIPFDTFTLEKTTPTVYEVRIRLNNDLLVWCSDGRWHNELDVSKYATLKPVRYTTPNVILTGKIKQLQEMNIAYVHAVLD